MSYDVLYRPFSLGSLHLENRIVMAPMTRCFAPGGVPAPGVVDYYRRRAAGGTGLIITEGTWVPHSSASNDPNAPDFFGEAALAAWKQVVDAVHAEGGKIAPQLWHVGLSPKPDIEEIYGVHEEDHRLHRGPSGFVVPGRKVAEPMSVADAEAIIEAYAEAAATAERLGFDAIELHGAHGYLIDQFFWSETNHRTDRFGGDIAGRTRFGVELVQAIRRRVASDLPIIMRISQWKMTDYGARLATTPAELEAFLGPLADAGVDMFHCSQRRFWESEFEGSPLNLAGWTRRLSGRPAISVGSLGLDQEMLGEETKGAGRRSFETLVEMMERGDFDLIAIGRGIIANPDWAAKVRQGDLGALAPYSPELLTALV